MSKPINICVIILVCTFFVGCVATPKKPVASIETQREHLTEKFYEKALSLEHQNELVEAKKNYQFAIAADASNKKAEQKITQINKRLQTLADKHYQKSIILHKKGKYNESKRYQLIALRLWPKHVKARQALIAGQMLDIQRYARHTIKKGETLSKISKTFYGNFNQSDIIARVNNIKDAACIRVGMKLKIPELKDHPFVHQKKAAVLEHLTDVSIQPGKRTDSLTMYKNMGINFFKARKFEDAVVELKKVLNADPVDKEAIEYISKAYYSLGSNAYAQKKYLVAIENCKNALNFNKNYSSCENMITQSRNLYNEYHYKSGMKFFDEQNLSLAILEWDLVYKMDPGYKKVAQLLNKAKMIQKNIKTLKQPE